MKVRNQSVDQVQADRARKDAGGGNHKRPNALSVFQGRKDQSNRGGRQHDACGKGQDPIVPFVGRIFKKEAQKRAKDGCAAYAKGGYKNKFHCYSFFTFVFL
jgi:hypothetical protein